MYCVGEGVKQKFGFIKRVGAQAVDHFRLNVIVFLLLLASGVQILP